MARHKFLSSVYLLTSRLYNFHGYVFWGCIFYYCYTLEALLGNHFLQTDSVQGVMVTVFQDFLNACIPGCSSHAVHYIVFFMPSLIFIFNIKQLDYLQITDFCIVTSRQTQRKTWHINRVLQHLQQWESYWKMEFHQRSAKGSMSPTKRMSSINLV